MRESFGRQFDKIQPGFDVLAVVSLFPAAQDVKQRMGRVCRNEQAAAPQTRKADCEAGCGAGFADSALAADKNRARKLVLLQQRPQRAKFESQIL